jgi:hypothetical protein
MIAPHVIDDDRDVAALSWGWSQLVG